MNTIPSIFNERQVKRTVIPRKEKPRGTEIPVCALLIDQGHQNRDTLLKNLVRNTFSSIISIETAGDNYNMEHTANLFPTVTFIVVQEEVTQGELINIAVEEAEEDLVFVLRGALRIGAQVLSKRLFERIRDEGAFCAVPRLVDRDNRALPVCYCPVIENNRFTLDVGSGAARGAGTVYTFDNIALYSKRKFVSLGGFDHTIAAPYWQTLDLCVRAWLWGERISVYSSLQLAYEGDTPRDDTTANASYLRFFLKNILPVLGPEGADIPGRGFFSFWRRSGHFFFEALAQFRDARRWTRQNRGRFVRDIGTLAASWQDISAQGQE
ncbi:MAG: hypothetical protein LBR23_08640 [Spirochaetaceae bacterium]|jgi:hypothetical protein|nr:hypothetical protein [Spirochaetaceae bacterium]